MKLPMKRIALLILDICLWSVPLASFSQYAPWVDTLRKVLPQFKIEQIRPKNFGFLDYPSPNGKWFAYVGEYYVRNIIDGEEAGGTLPVAISLYDKNGKFVREITYPRFYYIRDWKWSSSGNAIYFWVDSKWESTWSNGGLWKVDPRTNTYYHYWNKTLSLETPNGIVDPYATPHFPYLLEGAIPNFSPNGDSYLTLYQSSNSPKTSLVRVCMKSGKRLRLAVGDTYNPKWSPEGRWIAYQNENRKSLWIVRSDGRNRCNPITPAMLGKKTMIGYWWVTGIKPLILAEVAGGRIVNGMTYYPSWLWIIDTRGKIRKKVLLNDKYIDGISGSRDGTHLFFDDYVDYRIMLQGGG